MKDKLVIKIKIYDYELAIGQLHNLVLEWCESTSQRYNHKNLFSVTSGDISGIYKYIEISMKNIDFSGKTYLMYDIYNYVSYIIQTILISRNIKFDLEWKWEE